ncbi:class I SAM-dependent methyltransferase [Clostridium formicaceticum]|uniref:Family 2 glycosyl transferase n=1 Tax=Clostridium formicaceticum TaxID=1497 RepID=A0AAC9RM30_9CLOT|nr:class I SAM-dependent methyltransferase [Clostridium formicaceticum]AOY76987.1 hypothetical protein BJL90_14655 [Clostridium formicaceticum]ARE87473.1 hypothetical protein CLFO_18730 [Clostridium formicaceticum]
MNRFWDKIIQPIVEKNSAKHIVEIGCASGVNTKKILRFGEKKYIKLSAIDPKPLFNTNDLKVHYKDRFDFYKDISLNALPLLKDYDIVLIDGDHNWYTVYNELKLIEKSSVNKTFPIVFLHDVAWPYARRDLYYNPENIPKKFRHPYKKAGMKEGHSDLLKKGGLNAKLNNAIYEGNQRNGVLTAVEDFLKETKYDLSFQMTKKCRGLGIIYPKSKDLDVSIKNLLSSF